MIILYVRSDLGFHENQDEDKNGRYNRCAHHPGGERFLVTKGTDQPASLIGGGDREARRHIEFLEVSNKEKVKL